MRGLSRASAFALLLAPALARVPALPESSAQENPSSAYIVFDLPTDVPVDRLDLRFSVLESHDPCGPANVRFNDQSLPEGGRGTFTARYGATFTASWNVTCVESGGMAQQQLMSLEIDSVSGIDVEGLAFSLRFKQVAPLAISDIKGPAVMAVFHEHDPWPAPHGQEGADAPVEHDLAVELDELEDLRAQVAEMKRIIALRESFLTETYGWDARKPIRQCDSIKCLFKTIFDKVSGAAASWYERDLAEFGALLHGGPGGRRPHHHHRWRGGPPPPDGPHHGGGNHTHGNHTFPHPPPWRRPHHRHRPPHFPPPPPFCKCEPEGHPPPPPPPHGPPHHGPPGGHGDAPPPPHGPPHHGPPGDHGDAPPPPPPPPHGPPSDEPEEPDFPPPPPPPAHGPPFDGPEEPEFPPPPHGPPGHGPDGHNFPPPPPGPPFDGPDRPDGPDRHDFPHPPPPPFEEMNERPIPGNDQWSEPLLDEPKPDHGPDRHHPDPHGDHPPPPHGPPPPHHRGPPLPIVAKVAISAVLLVCIVVLVHRRCLRAREEKHLTWAERRELRRQACRQRRAEHKAALRRFCSRTFGWKVCGSQDDDDEEKTAMLQHSHCSEQQREDSTDPDTTIEEEIAGLRIAADVVSDMIAAEEGRARLQMQQLRPLAPVGSAGAGDGRVQSPPPPISPTSAFADYMPRPTSGAGDDEALPAYEATSSSTAPPLSVPQPRSETDEELAASSVVADGFMYTPGSSNYVPGSAASSVAGSGCADALGDTKN